MLLDVGRPGPASVVLSGILFASIAALLFGWYVPAFAAEHGVPIVDVDLHTPAQTLVWMRGYTPAARRAYLVFLGLDCIFPVAGSLFTIAVARFALASFDRERSALRYVLLLPVFAALADLLENAFHAALTLSYPDHAESLAAVAWTFTTMKLFFLLGAQVVLGMSLLALASKQIARLKPSGS